MVARPSFALVACQRSGTHLLREILNSNCELALASEPFSPSSQQIHWVNYARQLSETEFPPRHNEDAHTLLDRYVEAIHQHVDKEPTIFGCEKRATRSVGLDIKYNQLSTLQPLFHDLRAKPFLFQYFESRRVPVIHLVRDNVLHAAISMIIANKRQLWHVYNQQSPPVRCQIDTDELTNVMRWIVGERDQFRNLSSGLRMLQCRYEDVVADLARVTSEGRFGRSTPTIYAIAEFLGVDCDFQFYGQMKKVLDRPYSEIIENFHDVIRAVRRSEFFNLAGSI